RCSGRGEATVVGEHGESDGRADGADAPECERKLRNLVRRNTAWHLQVSLHAAPGDEHGGYDHGHTVKRDRVVRDQRGCFGGPAFLCPAVCRRRYWFRPMTN